MIKQCLTCGREKDFQISDIKKGYGKFCSQKCMGKWMSINCTIDKSRAWKGGRVNRKCLLCGGVFTIKKDRLKTNRGKYCSKKCAGLSRRNRFSKQNSPTWKGGITPEHSAIRTSNKYNIWRKSVFARDGFKCQMCNDSSGGNLHAHHIKKFSLIINDIRQRYPLLFIVDIADNFSSLWDVSNGITLCDKCHKKEHTRRK